MDRNDWLAERLEAQRTRMRALAYRMRMLASLSEADDAVQEASLPISGCSSVRFAEGCHSGRPSLVSCAQAHGWPIQRKDRL